MYEEYYDFGLEGNNKKLEYNKKELINYNILDKMDEQIEANKGIITPIFEYNTEFKPKLLDTINYMSIRDEYSLAYMLHNYFFIDSHNYTRKVLGYNFETMYIPCAKEVYDYIEFYKNSQGINLSYIVAKSNITANYIANEIHSKYKVDYGFIYGFMFTYYMTEEYTNKLYMDRKARILLNKIYSNIHNKFKLYRTMICYYKDYREYNCGYPIMRIFITNRPRVNTGNKYYCSTSLSKDINKVRQDLAMCIRTGLDDIELYK